MAVLARVLYLGILFYFLIFTLEIRDSNGQSWILYGIVWIIGILWYFYWAARRRRAAPARVARGRPVLSPGDEDAQW